MDLVELKAHTTVTDERQSCWTIRRTFLWGGHKLRTTIKHDPYQFQCDFYLEVFNPRELKWNRIHTAPSENAKAFNALSTSRLTAEEWIAIDALILRMVCVGQDLLEGVDA